MTGPRLPSAEQWRAWGIDPAWSRTLDVASHDGDVHTWHVLESGPAEPLGTIVCVHGNPTWSYLWHSLLQRLGERFRVIAVDQLGMGFSARIGLRRYAERVRDLHDVIAALGIDGPIVIAGHDWGGAVAMGWAVESGDRLAGMVLCNTGIAVPDGRRAPALIRLAAAGPITDFVGRRTLGFVEGALRLSRDRIAPVARTAYRAPYRSAVDRRAIAEFVADVPFDSDHPSAQPLALVAERLSTVTAPVLLTWGSADPVFDDSFALDLAGRMPHADRHRFPGVGHLSVEEADVAGTVDTWMEARVDWARPLPAALAEINELLETSAEPADGDLALRGTETSTVWAALAERSADATVAFVDGATGVRTSFAELHRRIMGIAAGLAERGLRPGERVAVLIPPGVDLVAAVYGIWRAGGVTVIADRGLGLRGLGRAVRGAQVGWVIGPPKALAAARTLRWAPRATTICVGRRASVGAATTLSELAALSAVLPPEPGPDDPAAVLYTSGATGPAKGVRYRHGQLGAQRDALIDTYRITSGDRLVAAFAPFALYGPALGIASTIPDVDVTRPGTLTADALAAACSSIDASIVFASPAALANVIRTSSGGVDRRFGAIRLILSAGAPVPAATLRAMAGLCPGAELHTPYGMTECLPVADISLADIDAAGPGDGVCVGYPVDGAEVLIAPLGMDTTEPVAAMAVGAMGEVLVRAPWVSDGYDQLWRTEHVARPRGDGGVVWHRSGDVGHLDTDGRLWIEGRSVHVVSTVAGPVTPVPIEVAVERLDGVERCAAVGVGPSGCQQLVIVVERSGADDGLAAEALARDVRQAVGRPIAAVLAVSSLPVDIRHNTKIDRTLVSGWAGAVLSGSSAKRPW